MTADQIRERLNTALKQFGEYSFTDKGAREVMDLNEIVEALNAMPAAKCIAVLEDVYQTKKKAAFAQQLVEEIVCCMDGIDDERWAELMMSPILAECY